MLHRLVFSLLGLSFVCSAGDAWAQPNVRTDGQQSPRADLCHVYVVDVEKAQKLIEEISALENPTEAQVLALKHKYPASEQILGEFAATVGEEELTTRSYGLPGTAQYVTASVFYTDEMMASAGHSNSMNVGIVVSPTQHDNALAAESSASSQISYGQGVDKIQVKTRTRVDGRLYVIGMECQCRAGTVAR